MHALHIAPNERTAVIIRKLVPQDRVFAYPILLAESDRTKWYAFLPDDLHKYAPVIVWHGNDANSLLLFYMLCSCHLPLRHIDLCTWKYTIFNHPKSIMNMITMSERGIRMVMGTQSEVSKWHRWINALRWKRLLLRPQQLVLLNSKYHLCYGSCQQLNQLILNQLTPDYAPISGIILGVMNTYNRTDNYISESFLSQRIHQLAQRGKLDIRPIESKASIQMGQHTRTNYEVKTHATI